MADAPKQQLRKADACWLNTFSLEEVLLPPPGLEELAPRAEAKDEAPSDDSTESGGDGLTELDSESDAGSSGDSSTPPVGFLASETLLIFDWDDTLLPTTWLQECGLITGEAPQLSDDVVSILSELSLSAARTIAAAKRCGRVIVVTNAVQGWVEWSCWHFLRPLLGELMGVPIVSARSRFEPQGAGLCEWKCLAFEEELQAYYGEPAEGQRRNVVSLGDSEHEHVALVRATTGIAGCSAKSLRFQQRPVPKELLQQHELARGGLREVVDFAGDLDVDLMLA